MVEVKTKKQKTLGRQELKRNPKNKGSPSLMQGNLNRKLGAHGTHGTKHWVSREGRWAEKKLIVVHVPLKHVP